MQDTFSFKQPDILLRTHFICASALHGKQQTAYWTISPGRVFVTRLFRPVHTVFSPSGRVVYWQRRFLPTLKQTLYILPKRCSKIKKLFASILFSVYGTCVEVDIGSKTETDYRITKGTLVRKSWLRNGRSKRFENCGINPDEYNGFAFEQSKELPCCYTKLAISVCFTKMTFVS
jgi:hypothetical protein